METVKVRVGDAENARRKTADVREIADRKQFNSQLQHAYNY
jgi:hypothetical protein